MSRFTLAFIYYSRVGNLFRAKKQKAAPISLVKLTEEFNMQVRIHCMIAE